MVSSTGKPRKMILLALQRQLTQLRQRVEALGDLRELNAAIERNQGKHLIPWETAKKELGLD
ncbi:MAG: hypothetical protein ABI651_11050 [Verrucomicrobiota bacterium]